MDFAVSAAIRAVNKFSPVLSRMGVDMGKFGSAAEGAFGRAGKSAGLFKTILGANLMTGVIRRLAREVGQIPKVIEAFAARGQEIGRTAQIIGVSAEAFQRLSYAAKLTDTPVDVLTRGMGLLNRSMGQLQAGTGQLNSMLRKIDPRLAGQLRTVQDSQEAFLVLSDAISRTKDVQTRAAIAQLAFGRSGQDLIPMLAQGREGLHRLMQEADKYGSVLDDQAVAAAGRLDDSLKRLRGSVQSVKDRVLGLVVRGITPYVEKAVAWVSANKELIASKITGFIDRTAAAIQRALPVVEGLLRAAGWLIKNWPFLGAVYVAWQIAQWALNGALSANPIGAVILGIEALVVAVLMVIKYWDQITGALRSAWNWFDRLYNKSLLLRNAIFFLASPIWLVVEAVRTLVDLIQGRGWKSFQNFIPPWLKGATDKLGITQGGGGQWSAPAEAPNAGRNWSAQVNGRIDVYGPPGTQVRNTGPRGAPQLLGYAGANP